MDIRIFDSVLRKFIAGLDLKTRAKILKTILLLEEFGHEMSMPHSKKITSELFELRIRGQVEVRIVYASQK